MGCATSKRKIVPDANANSIYSRDKAVTTETVKVNTPIRGDVTRRIEARRERERRIREKQGKIIGAAEAMSEKIMDEKERLSLSTRATSRATSGTSSPVITPTKKHVQFADTTSMFKSGSVTTPDDLRKKGDNTDADSDNRVISPENKTESFHPPKTASKIPAELPANCSPRKNCGNWQYFLCPQNRKKLHTYSSDLMQTFYVALCIYMSDLDTI